MSKASMHSDFLFLCRGMCTQTAAKWTQALSNAVALLDDLAFSNIGEHVGFTQHHAQDFTLLPTGEIVV